MRYEIIERPAAAVVKLGLDAGESITCEVGAMIAMSTAIDVQTTSRSRGGGGGVMQGLRRMFAGESLFLNHFTSRSNGQTLYIGPSLMGDISQHRLRGGSLVVQGGSWLASSSGVEIDTTWAGFTSALFSGESMFWVKCSGSGDVFLSSFGAVYEVDVTDGYVVDSGHIVAFEDSLSFSVDKVAEGWIASFLGGEGLVCKFRGQGKLYCQSHNPPNFGKLLGPMLKPR